MNRCRKTVVSGGRLPGNVKGLVFVAHCPKERGWVTEFKLEVWFIRGRKERWPMEGVDIGRRVVYK